MVQLVNIEANSPKIINRFVIIFGMVVILTLSSVANPDKVTLVTCYFQQLTGYPCPTCGMSHSFYAMAHLHLQDAFRFHLMGPILFLLLLLFIGKFAFEIAMNREIKIAVKHSILKISIVTFLGMWLVFWMTRLLGES